MKEFICSWIWSEDKKKENRIRLSWQGIDLLLGFGPRICLWLDWAREQKKRKETAFVLSWQRISFVVGFGTRTKKKKGNCIRFIVPKNSFCVSIWHENTKKEKKPHPFCHAPRIDLQLGFGPRTKERNRDSSFFHDPIGFLCGWILTPV